MRILYATMQYGFGYSQGTERYLTILSAGMRELGHEVVFLAGDPERRGGPKRLGDRISENPLILACPTHTWMAVEGAPAAEYLPLLRDQQPDVLHVANPGHIGLGLIDAAASLGIPIVITIMDYWWLCPKHTLHHFRRGVCDGNVTWRECVHCIAATHESAGLRLAARLPVLAPAILPQMLWSRARARGVSTAEIARWQNRRTWIPDRINDASLVIFPSRTAESLIAPLLDGPLQALIPYGLEQHWFASRQPERNDSERRTLPLIGFAGALQPHKGPHLLVQAVRDLGWTEARVRIAGGGDARYERRLRELARGLNVEFVGRIAPAQMPLFLGSLDLLVVPSLWPENLPIIVLEAYASRLPVMASDVGGIAELIEDRRFLFSTGSADQLSARLADWRQHRTTVEFPRVSSAAEMCNATLAVYERVKP
jgi:glycosyltransferase involved in cell wall biosynthesis